MKRWILLTLTLLALTPVMQAAEKNKGDLSNLVVFLRFANEGDTLFEKPLSHYEALFNDSTAGANSVYNYFKEASYNSSTGAASSTGGRYRGAHRLLPGTEPARVL